MSSKKSEPKKSSGVQERTSQSPSQLSQSETLNDPTRDQQNGPTSTARDVPTPDPSLDPRFNFSSRSDGNNQLQDVLDYAIRREPQPNEPSVQELLEATRVLERCPPERDETDRGFVVASPRVFQPRALLDLCYAAALNPGNELEANGGRAINDTVTLQLHRAQEQSSLLDGGVNDTQFRSRSSAFQFQDVEEYQNATPQDTLLYPADVVALGSFL